MAKKIKKKKNGAKKQKAKNTKAMKTDPVDEKIVTDSSMEISSIDEKSLKAIFKKNGVDEQDQRIFMILGVTHEDDADVNMENLETYFKYLKNKIKMPCIVTGIEPLGCFRWEEYFSLGPGSEGESDKEYHQLKKENPSFTDEYKLIEFNDYDEEGGVSVHVQRLSDKKKFYLTLCDLEEVDEGSKNAKLLHDYAVWFVNYI